MAWATRCSQSQYLRRPRPRADEDSLHNNISKDITAMIDFANEARDSDLLWINGRGRSLHTEGFVFDALITSVCRGDSDALRAALAQSRSDGDATAKTAEPLPASEYGSHQDNFARCTPKKTIPVERAPVLSQSAAACCTNASGERKTAGANFMCRTSGLSLLHYAVLVNQQEIIRFLLESGADPNRVTENSLRDICHWSNICITPLHVAAYLRNLESVSALVESGARVTKSLWQYLHVPNSHGCSGKILQFLLHNGRNFLPVRDAITISANSESAMPLFVRSGSCRWSPDYDTPCHALLLMLLKCSEARDLLRTKAYTAEEKLVKTCYMQYLLLCVCYFNSSHRSRHPDVNNDILIPALLSLLDVLISEGANPLGWSVRQVKIMNAAWEQLVDPECFGHMKSRRKSPLTDFGFHMKCCENVFETMRFTPGVPKKLNIFSPPCLHPAVVRVMRGIGDNDPIAERLVQLANQRAPCVLQTPQQARYAYGCPEKGPRCTNASLPEEQKRAPLCMCFYAFSHVPSLSARCRDVILCVLPEGSFLQSVRDLPLPEKMKWYIISG